MAKLKIVPAPSTKSRKPKYTLQMALRKEGISKEEEKYLSQPRIAAAMARAARKELKKVREEVDRQFKRRHADLFSEALKNCEFRNSVSV